MSGDNINRRDVLRSASVGAAAVFGSKPAVATEETDYGPVRLVEIGIRYRLSEENSYSSVAYDGLPVYYLDGDEIIVHTSVPERERVFERNDTVVGTDSVNSVPTTVAGTTPVESLVTGLRGRRLPARAISLEEPYTPPTVAVRETPRGLIAVAGGTRVRLDPGTEETVTLPPETVTARTFRMVDESPDIEGIPDWRVGPTTEFDQVTVEVEPEVLITDRGEVPVARVRE